MHGDEGAEGMEGIIPKLFRRLFEQINAVR
jgi:hypothetical protein